MHPAPSSPRAQAFERERRRWILQPPMHWRPHKQKLYEARKSSCRDWETAIHQARALARELGRFGPAHSRRLRMER